MYAEAGAQVDLALGRIHCGEHPEAVEQARCGVLLDGGSVDGRTGAGMNEILADAVAARADAY